MDYVIIVAGGKGLRMGSDIPKQFLPIGGKPVLMRTLERFREYSSFHIHNHKIHLCYGTDPFYGVLQNLIRNHVPSPFLRNPSGSP